MYLEGFPCTIQALELSVGGKAIGEAAQDDAEVLAAVRPGAWYWIPQTVFVAVACRYSETVSVNGDGGCILMGLQSHGTEVASVVMQENPAALLAFTTPNTTPNVFHEGSIPVDIAVSSVGNLASGPIPAIATVEVGPLFVKAAGNRPTTTMLNAQDANPAYVLVGGGYAAPPREEVRATKTIDVVSHYCRPVADARTAAEYRFACGTSFAAPTVAGALSLVVLGTRKITGYTGSAIDGMLDPIAGLTKKVLRDALNHTASYSPSMDYGGDPGTGVPLAQNAPWFQWGWGFFDATMANATIGWILAQERDYKPEQCQIYMGTIFAIREVLYGGDGP